MRELTRDVPVLRHDAPLREALRTLLDSKLPALPVAGRNGRYAGVFGEREFLEALFPAYLKTLGSAAFVPEILDEAIEQRSTCLLEHVDQHTNSEHVELPPDAGNASIAEVFLHHRVLIVPVVDDGRVLGVVTRADFFRRLAERVLA